MNTEFNFNAEYLEECAKRRKKPEERIYPKKDWPVGYEPTKKEFEEWMEEGTGVPVSFHWEDIGGGKKRGVFTPIPIKKSVENLTDFEKTFGQGESVNFQIKNQDGELKKVSKEEFARWMVNEKKDDKKQVEKPEESYYQPRSEKEKNQVIERNRKIREQELEKKEKVNLEPKTQNPENSQTEKLENKQIGEVNSSQKNEVQATKPNDGNWKSPILIAGSVGGISLLGIVVAIMIKKKNKKRFKVDK